jgi:hypothetical protein
MQHLQFTEVIAPHPLQNYSYLVQGHKKLLEVTARNIWLTRMTLDSSSPDGEGSRVTFSVGVIATVG